MELSIQNWKCSPHQSYEFFFIVAPIGSGVKKLMQVKGVCCLAESYPLPKIERVYSRCPATFLYAVTTSPISCSDIWEGIIIITDLLQRSWAVGSVVRS
jgi:hypothetical protein